MSLKFHRYQRSTQCHWHKVVSVLLSPLNMFFETPNLSMQLHISSIQDCVGDRGLLQLFWPLTTSDSPVGLLESHRVSVATCSAIGVPTCQSIWLWPLWQTIVDPMWSYALNLVISVAARSIIDCPCTTLGAPTCQSIWLWPRLVIAVGYRSGVPTFLSIGLWPLQQTIVYQ